MDGVDYPKAAAQAGQMWFDVASAQTEDELRALHTEFFGFERGDDMDGLRGDLEDFVREFCAATGLHLQNAKAWRPPDQDDPVERQSCAG